MRTLEREAMRAIAVALVCVAAVGARAAENGKAAPATCSPAMEAAAGALADGRFEAAEKAFAAVAADSSAPAFVRSLALLGVAQSALRRNDAAAATKAWEQLAGDASLPMAHRDIAKRRLAEARRVSRGLPARDPVAYRAQLPTLPTPAVTLRVGPADLRTLEQARDAIRAIKKEKGGAFPKGGVRVIIRGGDYAVSQTLRLTAEDSGTADAPVVYMANAGETPVFKGGIRIALWKPISDQSIRAKLDESVRGRVLEADLKALGVKDWGDATAERNRPELFCDGVPQTLARWPNEGFVKTGEVLGTQPMMVWGRLAGCKDGKFRYVEDRPGRWADEPDVRLYGYWFWDWAEQYQKVSAIDPAGKTITLAQPYSHYGYRKGQRYYAVNVLSELDRPGEWYLDRRSGMVYWLPPEGVNVANATVMLSVFARPLIEMDNAQHVILAGLTFQDARGNGIEVRGGSECLIAGCTLKQLGGDAIVIQGGTRHGIFGCTMHTLGCGGARVAGGDRSTLAPGEHFVENCTVYNISRLTRTYTPAVHLDGCGNRIAHNLFEGMSSSAMRIEGNDHIIELNAIRRAVQESDDQGGVDMFGNPLYRGVVFRWNRWSDITGGTECGAAGVRLDDMISGVAVYGNIFERCGAALFGGVQVHGGKENLIDGNLFVDCYAGVSFSRWGQKRWTESIQRFLRDAGGAVYAGRYPELAKLAENPDVNYVGRNVFANCKSVFLRDGGVERNVLNVVTDRSVDPTVLSDERAIKGEPLLRGLLIEPIPVDEIGPYAHPWRAAADAKP